MWGGGASGWGEGAHKVSVGGGVGGGAKAREGVLFTVQQRQQQRVQEDEVKTASQGRRAKNCVTARSKTQARRGIHASAKPTTGAHHKAVRRRRRPRRSGQITQRLSFSLPFSAGAAFHLLSASFLLILTLSSFSAGAGQQRPSLLSAGAAPRSRPPSPRGASAARSRRASARASSGCRPAPCRRR